MTDVTIVAHKDDVKEYPECKVCGLDYCPSDCFKQHVGSMVALEKILIKEGHGVKMRLVK